jgi:uroporphyrinogen decarboxylase
MTHKERFLATIARQPVDRPASWLGIPTRDAIPPLFEHFQVDSMAALKRKLDDDIYPVEVPYRHPPANHIACAAFGMENALMTMLETPEMFQAVIDRILEFYLEANEIFYQAAGDKLDAVLIGNDFGSQTGLMVGADALRRFVFPGTRKLIEQAHAHGYKVIHHSCGAICPIIEDLAGLGADAIHPIQALARDMDAATLERRFGGRVSFCGGVDAQDLLVNGQPEAVRQAVAELKARFPTGLIISPSHEAILPDIAPHNIEALFS